PSISRRAGTTMSARTSSTPSAEHRQRGARAAFSTSHRRLLALCHQLEEFADALPNRLDQARCGKVAKTMLPLLKACHATEERLIDGMDASRKRKLAASIVRLMSEHLRDQYFAEDIVEALGQVSDDESSPNPEAFGFMLRSFFETQRRHIAFEQEHIVPHLPDQPQVSGQ
ncbi:MAG: hemerythrin domain-containing protein, partial [Mesorhizobium sp.]|nr:hemerythrin domain-containing protein [Mesorhizobium sp.]